MFVIRPHVVQTVSVEQLMTKQFAHVSQLSLAHHHVVDQNALLVLSVWPIRPVLIKSVLTLVLECVVLTLNVTSLITVPFVLVNQISLEILSFDVSPTFVSI